MVTYPYQMRCADSTLLSSFFLFALQTTIGSVGQFCQASQASGCVIVTSPQVENSGGDIQSLVFDHSSAELTGHHGVLGRTVKTCSLSNLCMLTFLSLRSFCVQSTLVRHPTRKMAKVLGKKKNDYKNSRPVTHLTSITQASQELLTPRKTPSNHPRQCQALPSIKGPKMGSKTRAAPSSAVKGGRVCRCGSWLTRRVSMKTGAFVVVFSWWLLYPEIIFLGVHGGVSKGL